MYIFPFFFHSYIYPAMHTHHQHYSLTQWQVCSLKQNKQLRKVLLQIFVFVFTDPSLVCTKIHFLAHVQWHFSEPQTAVLFSQPSSLFIVISAYEKKGHRRQASIQGKLQRALDDNFLSKKRVFLWRVSDCETCNVSIEELVIVSVGDTQAAHQSKLCTVFCDQKHWH